MIHINRQNLSRNDMLISYTRVNSFLDFFVFKMFRQSWKYLLSSQLQHIWKWSLSVTLSQKIFQYCDYESISFHDLAQPSVFFSPGKINFPDTLLQKMPQSSAFPRRLLNFNLVNPGLLHCRQILYCLIHQGFNQQSREILQTRYMAYKHFKSHICIFKKIQFL